jgi:hypothetical protein
MEWHHSEEVMADRDPLQPDAYEQTGGGLREFLISII